MSPTTDPQHPPTRGLTLSDGSEAEECEPAESPFAQDDQLNRKIVLWNGNILSLKVVRLVLEFRMSHYFFAGHCMPTRLFRPLPIIIKFMLECLLLHLWHLLAMAANALTLPGSDAVLTHRRRSSRATTSG
jgi:hypothetical protein